LMRVRGAFGAAPDFVPFFGKARRFARRVQNRNRSPANSAFELLPIESPVVSGWSAGSKELFCRFSLRGLFAGVNFSKVVAHGLGTQGGCPGFFLTLFSLPVRVAGL